MKKNSVVPNKDFADLLKEIDPATDASDLIQLVVLKCGYFQNPTTRYEKKSTFASIANALFVLKGKRYAVKYAKLIDTASGSYYKQRAKANVQDLARTFVDPTPKKRVIHHSQAQHVEISAFVQNLSQSQTHTPVESIYALYASSAKKPVSRYVFTALMKQLGYSVAVKRIHGVATRCFLHIEYQATSSFSSFLYFQLVTLFLHTMNKIANQHLVARNNKKRVRDIVICVFLFSLARAPPSRITIKNFY